MARYRACSPVHIMYLQNMGVCGSMSLSLVVNGKLWGLVACHNYVEFRPVSLPTAVMYEVLARSFSLQIFTIEQEELRNGVLWSNKVRVRGSGVPSRLFSFAGCLLRLRWVFRGYLHLSVRQQPFCCSDQELEGIMKSDDADLPENMSVYSGVRACREDWTFIQLGTVFWKLLVAYALVIFIASFRFTTAILGFSCSLHCSCPQRN